MARLALIGGSGLTSIDELKVLREQHVDTPYGITSAPFIHGKLAGAEVVFLPRHGNDQSIPPHKINYCANIWGLHSVGITHIIAVTSVGGINPDIPPERIVVPDQIIDYTYSRKQTFFSAESGEVRHIDFTQPYCEEMRQIILKAARNLNVNVFVGGTYAATQGPRLETAAEITRLEKDGCDIVGMTGMPEASLAKELGLCYAICALSVNWAAGKSANEITIEEIKRSVAEGMTSLKHLLRKSVSLLKYI